MKILFVLSNMDLGGTEKSFLNLLAELPIKPTIDLVLLEKSGLLLDQLPSHVNVEEIGNSTQINAFIRLGARKFAILELLDGNIISFIKNIVTFILGKLGFNVNYFWGVGHYIKRKSSLYDCAVAYAGPYDFISYYVSNKIVAKNKIQWIHFDIEKVLTHFKFGNKYYPFFDKIVCVSRGAKDIFIKHFPQLEDKTEVFHNIVSDIELKRQAAAGPTYYDECDGLRILTVGRFTKEKGQHLIPPVAKKLKEAKVNFQWYLVGDGIERVNVEQMALEYGISERLVFLGEKANPYRFMQDCDVYVQPSLHEGFGITVAEAKVFNKPMVITNFASAKDLVVHGETGLISEISADSLYTQLYKLLDDSALMKKIRNNLEKSKSGDSSKEMVSKLLHTWR